MEGLQPLKLTGTHVQKPWGWFCELLSNLPLANGHKLNLKDLRLREGEQLSDQRHRLRAESWYLISGQMKTVINEKTTMLYPGDKVYIPVLAWHTAEGIKDCDFIEVAIGHFDEDDIERRNDKYGRV